MDISLDNAILAIITANPDKIAGSGAPIFLCDSKDEMDQVAFYLGKLLGAMVHDLKNGVLVIVRH